MPTGKSTPPPRDYPYSIITLTCRIFVSNFYLGESLTWLKTSLEVSLADRPGKTGGQLPSNTAKWQRRRPNHGVSPVTSVKTLSLKLAKILRGFLGPVNSIRKS